jgi:uncharacterized protein
MGTATVIPQMPTTDQAIQQTRHWLETAVIGLGFCPFAGPVHARGLIRFVVSAARSETELESDLIDELLRLQSTSPNVIETTLLIHPWVLNHFPDFNEFLEVADHLLEVNGLVGEFQVASFHPDYQFAGVPPGDITHFTNRSPFPTLHLLRESSVTRAVASMPDIDSIIANNQATLHQLGHPGWDALRIGQCPMKPASNRPDCESGESCKSDLP